MMATVRVIEAEPHGSGIVEMLEDWLKEARGGRISSLALAVVHRDGAISAEWSEAPSMPLLIGAASRLTWRLNNALEEE